MAVALKCSVGAMRGKCAELNTCKTAAMSCNAQALAMGCNAKGNIAMHWDSMHCHSDEAATQWQLQYDEMAMHCAALVFP